MAHSGASPRILPLKSLPMAGFTLLVVLAAALSACGTADEPEGVVQPAEEPTGQQAEAVAAPQAGPGGIITFAGTGSPRFEGDGGPATNAGFYAPSGIALDRDGNAYISTDNRIRRVDAATGVITTVAGSGRGRFEGDGGPAVDAHIAEPKGMAIDRAGNLLFADYNNNRVRRIEAATGIITTAAGGQPGVRISKEVGDGGPATSAVVRDPMDIAVDGQGNIFIIGDQRLRRVEALSGIISTIAGTGQRGLSGDDEPSVASAFAEPEGVALDARGNIFIADAGNHRIRRVDGTTGAISTVAGLGKFGYIGLNEQEMPRGGSGGGYSGDGGPGTNAKLTLPSSVAIGPDGNVYFADGAVRVRKIDTATGIISTVAAGETVGVEKSGKIQIHTKVLGQIASIAINDAGEIFLADFKKNLVHKLTVPSAQ